MARQIKLMVWNGTSWVDAAGDAATGALAIVDYPHHEVHEGEAYELSAIDVDLDTADKLTIAFKTPDTTKWLHCVVLASNSSASKLEVLRGPTITNGTGSDMVPYNRNHNSQNTSGVSSIKATPVAGQATLTPTITVDGTAVHTQVLGTGKDKGSSGSRGDEERVLAQNTVYAFRITGLADNGLASLSVSYYEHTDDN